MGADLPTPQQNSPAGCHSASGATQIYDFTNVVNLSSQVGHPVLVVQAAYRQGAFGFPAGKEISKDGKREPWLAGSAPRDELGRRQYYRLWRRPGQGGNLGPERRYRLGAREAGRNVSDQPCGGITLQHGTSNEMYLGYKRKSTILGVFIFDFYQRAYLDAVSGTVPAWSFLNS